MVLIRLLHPREYDKNSGRFRSTCFNNSSDGTGISLVDIDCVTERFPTSGVYQHIEQYYPRIVGEPIAYWTVPADLPSGVYIEETASDTGDPCHRELHGFSGRASQKFFKRAYHSEQVSLCLDGLPVPGSQAFLDAMFA